MNAQTEVLRDTRSVCPICRRVIGANLIEEDGRIVIAKECPEHGEFKSLYWSDAAHYRKLISFEYPLDNGRHRNLECPLACGLCDEHEGNVLIALIDITNRCNLNCPICFSSSESKMQHPFELSAAQIRQMLTTLKGQGTPGRITVQYSGGEPTLRDDLPALVSMAKEMGFGRVEINTHGIRIGQEPEYAKALKDAGLDAIGLQFDSTDDEVYRFVRGVNLMEKKQKTIEVAREVGIRVILVVTLVKGVNDKHVGNIIRFAAKNQDVIKRVVAQTLTFTGRGSNFNPDDYRLTLFDYLTMVEDQTGGVIKKSDFYPVALLAPVPDFLEALSGKPQDKLVTHPCCDLATFIYISDDGQFVPLNQLIPVQKVIGVMAEGAIAINSASSWRKGWVKFKYVGRLLGLAIREVRNPVFRRLIVSSLINRSYDPMADMDQVLMLNCTSHMDGWNFDVERVENCAIHYLTPDGKLIPFCSYNAFYRADVEAQFSASFQMKTQ